MRCFMLIAVSLMAGYATAAHANLGGTFSEIEASYGAGQETKTNPASGVTTSYFIHGGFGISVKFLEGKSQSETYVKEGKADISDSEIALLLKANAMGSDWQSIYKNATAERWQLKSRAATAVYSFTEHTLMISTKDYLHVGSSIRVIDQPVD